MTDKQCNVCEEMKPFAAFYINGRTKNGVISRRPECNECLKAKRYDSTRVEKYCGMDTKKDYGCGELFMQTHKSQKFCIDCRQDNKRRNPRQAAKPKPAQGGMKVIFCPGDWFEGYFGATQFEETLNIGHWEPHMIFEAGNGKQYKIVGEFEGQKLVMV